MTTMRRIILLLLLIPLAGPGQAGDACVRQVFGKYCLGGRFSEQLKATPTSMPPRTKGERSGVVYQSDNERIYVMAYQGVIYKVLHTFEPRTRSTLNKLRRLLQREYGLHRDYSHFPSDTHNKARQLSSVRRGDGEIRYLWQSPGQPWRVELSWNRELGISIAYYLNALDKQQKEAALKGL